MANIILDGTQLNGVTYLDVPKAGGGTARFSEGGGGGNYQSKSKTYTPTESQQTETITPGTGYDALSQVNVTVNAISSTYVGSAVPTQGATTITPTESVQTAVASGKYTTGAVSVGAISSTYVGSGITQNDSSDLTASGATVTAPAGYYANNATYTIPSGSATTPATTITANPSISVSGTGLITATASASQSVTPTVVAGYTSTGTAGTVSVSGSDTYQLPTVSSSVYMPAGFDRTIAYGNYITGNIIIKAAPKATKTITVNGEYDPADEDLYGYDTVTVNVPPSGITLQNKSESYTPTASQQTDSISADAGYDGLGTVDITIDPIPPQYIVPSGTVHITSAGTYTTDITNYATASIELPLQSQSRTFTPNGGAQADTVTADAGYAGLSAVNITVDPIPPQYIIPSGDISITSNGSGIDVSGYATATVSVPATVGTKTSASLSSTTTTLSISGLSAKPKMWALQNVVSNGSYFSGASTRYITSCLCDGGSTVYSLCIYKSGSTAREYGYNTCTWSYSSGTITITSPGTGTAGGFRTGSTYRLFYAY